MNAILTALAIVGAFVAALTVGVVSYLLVAVKLDHRAEAKRRAEQGREVDAAYLASLAADEGDDLIYQAMCFERWEAEL